MLEHFEHAVASGDMDGADRAAAVLGQRLDARSLAAATAESIVASTAAAAHGPIFLFLLRRASPYGELTTELFRPLARELARHPEWRIGWADGVRSRAAPADLFDRLATAPRLGVVGNGFIHPTLAQVDPQPAQAHLGDAIGLDHEADMRTILRAAALSMLHEPPDYAPYGWTHCLTIPQSIAALASKTWRPDRTMALAATHVFAFRAAFAVRPLPRRYTPARPGIDWRAALDVAPDTAAAAVWHAPAAETGAIRSELASRAAVGHDAHQAKYVVASFDASDYDRSQARLYLAAAAYLVAWWTTTGPAA